MNMGALHAMSMINIFQRAFILTNHNKEWRGTMRKIKENKIAWMNQKYLLAIDKLPEGYYTINSYVDKFYPYLDNNQKSKFGYKAYKQYNGPLNLIKDRQLGSLRYYTKEYLDEIFIKFAQES